MPKITPELLNKSKSKIKEKKISTKPNKKTPFVAKEYRPWNIEGKESNTPPYPTIKTLDSYQGDKLGEEQVPSSKITSGQKEIFLKGYKSIYDTNNPLLNKKNVENFKVVQENSKGTVREQQGNNKGTVREQQGNNKGTVREQQGNSKGTDKGTPREQVIREQQGNSKGTTSNQDKLNSLVGNGLKVITYLFDLCQISGTRKTPTVTYESIAKLASIVSKETVKTTIKRLIKEEILIREPGKKGNGGWTQFSFSEALYQQLYIISNKREQQGNNKGTVREQQGNSKGTDKGTNALSSSSSSINTNKENTTNNENLISPDQQNIFELPKEWMDINFDRLKDFGFGMPQLKQLYKLDNYSAEDIQSYIEMLDFDIINNDKTFRTGLSNGFMGILRKGDGYTAPKGYESPMDELLREEIEKKKAHLEKIKKMEEELFIISYETWIIETPVEELERIDGNVAGMPKFAKEGILKTYFKNNIFKRENHGG